MKKKAIIQLVKETIKEVQTPNAGQYNFGNRQGPSSFSTSAIAPAGDDPYTGKNEYPFTVRPKRTGTGMMEQEKTPIFPNFTTEVEEDKIIVYPDLDELKWKSRSSQEIVFTKTEGKISFVRAFGYRPIYDELKKVLPEIPSPGTSMYSGFINILTDDGPIPVDMDTAEAMIEAMRKGKEIEAGAQSTFYTREPGRGGTGIDEMEKEYGAKISPEEFKSKMPVGKTVLYGGTRYKVLENTGYVLTLQSLESKKTITVNFEIIDILGRDGFDIKKVFVNEIKNAR